MLTDAGLQLHVVVRVDGVPCALPVVPGVAVAHGFADARAAHVRWAMRIGKGAATANGGALLLRAWLCDLRGLLPRLCCAVHHASTVRGSDDTGTDGRAIVWGTVIGGTHRAARDCWPNHT